VIRAVIADDERPAREGIRERLRRHHDITITGEAADGAAAVEVVTRVRPDLLFLDVQMPNISGIEVVEHLAERHLPVIVFVTAYDRYALHAFDVNAVDYLLKPYTDARFEDALSRARTRLQRIDPDERLDTITSLLAPRGRELTRLPVRKGDRFFLLPIERIDWISAAGNYVELHAGDASYLHRVTLSRLETQLNPRRFGRIHRSTIVNLDRVASIRPNARGDFVVALTSGAELKMARSYRESLLGWP
jgi:two-component system LytT family response regulator